MGLEKFYSQLLTNYTLNLSFHSKTLQTKCFSVLYLKAVSLKKKKKSLNGQDMWNDIKFMLIFKWGSTNFIVLCELLDFILFWFLWPFFPLQVDLFFCKQPNLRCSARPLAAVPALSTVLAQCRTCLPQCWSSWQFSSCKPHPAGSGGSPGWTAQQEHPTAAGETRETPWYPSVRWCLCGKGGEATWQSR